MRYWHKFIVVIIVQHLFGASLHSCALLFVGSADGKYFFAKQKSLPIVALLFEGNQTRLKV